MLSENEIKKLYDSLALLAEVISRYPQQNYDLEVLDNQIKIKTDAREIAYEEYGGLSIEPMNEGENGEKLNAVECFVLASEIINSRAKALVISRIR